MDRMDEEPNDEPPVNAQAWGAKFDGITDDAPAIQAAINSFKWEEELKDDPIE